VAAKLKEVAMKPRLALTVVLLFASIVLLSVPLRSQVGKQFLFRVNIPFAFVAADAHLPAGDYSVFRVMGPDVLLVESDNNPGSAVLLVRQFATGQRNHVNQLVFNQYGDQRFLVEVWTSSDGLVHTAVKCRQEVLAAKGALLEERVLAVK